MISVFYFCFKALFDRYVSEVCLRLSFLSSTLQISSCLLSICLCLDIPQKLKPRTTFKIMLLLFLLKQTKPPTFLSWWHRCRSLTSLSHIFATTCVCFFSTTHTQGIIVLLTSTTISQISFPDSTLSALHLPLLRSFWIPTTSPTNKFPFFQPSLSKKLIQRWRLAFKIFPKLVLIVGMASSPLGVEHTVASPVLGPLVCYSSSHSGHSIIYVRAYL